MTNWSYEEFLAFTMLYAASADMNISEDEEAIIKKKISTEQYDKIKSCFDECNDTTIINTILSYHDQFFATDEQRKQLLKEMRSVFEADHQYSIMERNLMKLFKHLI
jgi:uncharacterized tellurite resistance protein B-like protein